MEIRLLSADDAIAYWGDRYLDEEYMVFHVKTSYTTEIKWIETPNLCKRHLGNSICGELFGFADPGNQLRDRTELLQLTATTLSSVDESCYAEGIPLTAAATTDRHRWSSRLQNWTC